MFTNGSRILCIGDSTTMGYSSDSVDYKLDTWPTCMTALLKSNNYNASCENFFGSLFGLTYPNLDSRLTVPSSWITEGGGYFGYYSIGGGLLQATNTSDKITFKPRGTLDTIEIFTPSRGANIQVTITNSSNGVLATQQIQTQQIDVLQKTTIQVPLSSGITISINAIGTPAYLCGLSAYAVGDIQVLNAGVGGATSQCWNDNSALTRAKDCIQFIRPDMIILCLGINDYWHAVTDYIPGMKVGSFQNQMQELIKSFNFCKTVIFTPNPTNAVDLATQRIYCNSIISLASKNKVYVTDVNNLMTDYSTASGAGYVTNDGVHPTKLGYKFIAQQIYNFIKTI